MKTLICLALTVSAINWGFAQSNTEVHTWNITLKVVDENSGPVAGANVGVGYYSNSVPASIDGITDTNGLFTASHAAQLSLLGYAFGLDAQKAGYYPTRMQHHLDSDYDPAKWNPTVTLILKKIGQPVPMFARRAQIEIPIVDKPVGFDLVEYDWVAPYGNGKQGDIVFETHRRWVNPHDFDSTLKVTFSNSGDGLIVSPASLIQGSSGPRLSATAPLEGYKAKLQHELSNTPTGGWKDDSTDQNYFFRIRTVLDGQGNVRNALYGKLYGDFSLDPINSKTTWILFAYYLNPTPNDRNAEFDPNRNLFKNLPALQQVKDP